MIFANYNPQRLQNCAGYFLSSPETFFCRNLKNDRISFLDQCNVETASRLGLQGLSCSKVAGFEGGLFQKLFKGYIFCFLGNSFGKQIFELFAHETNLEKNRSVLLRTRSERYLKEAIHCCACSADQIKPPHPDITRI